MCCCFACILQSAGGSGLSAQIGALQQSWRAVAPAVFARTDLRAGAVAACVAHVPVEKQFSRGEAESWCSSGHTCHSGGPFRDRQTDSFNWDTNPHTPRLYFKPAPPLHLPRYTDLQGLHQLIMDVEKYYASPAGSRRLMAPPVKCGESRCSDVYH